MNTNFAFEDCAHKGLPLMTSDDLARIAVWCQAGKKFVVVADTGNSIHRQISNLIIMVQLIYDDNTTENSNIYYKFKRVQSIVYVQNHA